LVLIRLLGGETGQETRLKKMKECVSAVLLLTLTNISWSPDGHSEATGDHGGTVIRDAPYGIEMVELPSGTVEIEATYANMH
jgi:hypothetical protein